MYRNDRKSQGIRLLGFNRLQTRKDATLCLCCLFCLVRGAAYGPANAKPVQDTRQAPRQTTHHSARLAQSGAAAGKAGGTPTTDMKKGAVKAEGGKTGDTAAGATPGATSGATPGANPDTPASGASASEMETAIQNALDNTFGPTPGGWKATIKVVKRPDSELVGILSDSPNSPRPSVNEKARAESVLKGFVDVKMLAAFVTLLHDPDADSVIHPSDATSWLNTVVEEVWPLTFMPSDLTSVLSGKKDTAKSTTATAGTNNEGDKGAPVNNTTITVTSTGTGGAATSDAAASVTKNKDGADKAGADTENSGATKNDPQADTSGGKKDSAQILVDALNDMFKLPNNSLPVHQREKYLIMRAPRRTVLKMKQIITMVDSPWPQVQLDVWAFQASGDRNGVAPQVQEMSERIQRTRRSLLAVTEAFQSALNVHRIAYMLADASTPPKPTSTIASGSPAEIQAMTAENDSKYRQLLADLKDGGFETDTQRPLSLNEMLILLSIVDYDTRKLILDELNVAVGRELMGAAWVRNRADTDDWLRQLKVGRDKDGYYLLKHLCGLLLLPEEMAPVPPALYNTSTTALSAVATSAVATSAVATSAVATSAVATSAVASPPAIPPDSAGLPMPPTIPVDVRRKWSQAEKVERVRAGISRFLTSRMEFEAITHNPNDQDLARYYYAPDVLRKDMATADRMLYLGMDAYSADMHTLFLDHLVDQFAGKTGRAPELSGVGLTGRTRLVVTSGIESALTATLASYTDTTNPAPLGADFVKGLFGSAGLAGALSGYSAAQAAGLGILLAEPEPELTRVSPGIELYVRPAVLPDSGSARLQISARFGVETTVQERVNGKNGIWKSVPFDAVQSHNIETDAVVNAFDVFDISSFTVQSSFPRNRSLPVIGYLPLLRDLFKRPPHMKTKEHESLILVNAAIVPRSFDLARLYAGNLTTIPQSGQTSDLTTTPSLTPPASTAVPGKEAAAARSTLKAQRSAF